MTVNSPKDFAYIDAEVGARVRLVRERRKMSQSALGEKIGVSFQQIQKYERGANRISASALFQIARALDVRPSDFFDGIQKEEPRDLNLQTTADPQINDLLNGFGLISSPAVRAKIVDLVRSLAEADDGGALRVCPRLT